jgi:predicted nucleic acid-binding protein
MKTLIDTNICIDILRGYQPAVQYLLKLNNMETWISSITVMELYAAPRITPEQKERMAGLIAGFNGIIDIDQSIARTAGEFIAKYRKDYSLNPMDALIAAAALFLDAVLITRNAKHFDYIEGMIVQSPYR